ncbi:hypothetical protein [Streptomyces tanashiensis]|uniref:Uncharacterized protein n=2 Tax=Streptomyces tanashiensis TaxID=67367 RepID=A0ABY6QRL0_9ACTN|nr:hypothetical protein [Streptomyces tanashiensis]UZX19879.1 hypothetical protein LDH80_03685 [Streptomyces tanashiensis]GGY42338.1 hypothetical protein GCM10010299_55790 [Streptomyces tanashiensis]
MSHVAQHAPSGHPASLARTRSRQSGSLAPCAPVRGAFALWVTAVAAGVFETVLAVARMVGDGSGSGGEIAIGLAIRLPVFAAALLIALRMRSGRAWARITLTLALGVAGTASMVVQPIRALVQGRSLGAAFEEAGAMDIAFGASRALHVAAVLTAVVLMFLPTANAYFRAHRADRASAATRETGPGRSHVG